MGQCRDAEPHQLEVIWFLYRSPLPPFLVLFMLDNIEVSVGEATNTKELDVRTGGRQENGEN